MTLLNQTLGRWVLAAILTSCCPCLELSAGATDQKPIAAKPQKESPQTGAPIKRGTIADLKGGMTDRELIRLLGTPSGIEGKSNYEIWLYPSGVVYVSPKGAVIAWKENKRIIIIETR